MSTKSPPRNMVTCQSTQALQRAKSDPNELPPIVDDEVEINP